MSRIYSVLLLLCLSTSIVFSQNYIDTQYQIATDLDVNYGTAYDFAGNLRPLSYDVSYPTDNPSSCGRPLIVLIHGGAFLAGDKGDGTLVALRTQFAQRGYVAMSVNYRLGMFQTDKQINCNVSGLGANWNCLNMADSAEWHRANHRAIQDVHGAIRYITSNRNTYRIDSKNVFVSGESAGGFVALGVGFLDDESEQIGSSISKLATVAPPNSIYESECVVGYGLDTSIAKMEFKRDSLGGYLGYLNPPIVKNYEIQGVGNIFGAVFNDIFKTYGDSSPVLYLFHQPNDLIVPIKSKKVFHGYNACVSQQPFNCQNIINRPLVSGSDGIKAMIDSVNAKFSKKIRVQYDRTNNNANCAAQILNSATVGHQIDNLGLRSKNMAVLFASAIDTCSSSKVKPVALKPFLLIKSNPVATNSELEIVYTVYEESAAIRILNLNGTELLRNTLSRSGHSFKVSLNNYAISEGIYFLEIRDGTTTVSKKLLVVE